jgi:hypothetical protein
MHLFLTDGAGTGNTFTTKALFQMLIRIYDSSNSSDPMKPKGLIVAYIGKVAYNAGGTTVHSAFFMPFNKSYFYVSKHICIAHCKKKKLSSFLVFPGLCRYWSSHHTVGVALELLNIHQAYIIIIFVCCWNIGCCH